MTIAVVNVGDDVEKFRSNAKQLASQLQLRGIRWIRSAVEQAENEAHDGARRVDPIDRRRRYHRSMAWLIIAPLACLALGSWLSAMIHWMISLGHLSGRTSASMMFFRGYEAFNGDNFTPVGQRYQKRFVISSVVFLLSILLSILASVIASTLR